MMRAAWPHPSRCSLFLRVPFAMWLCPAPLEAGLGQIGRGWRSLGRWCHPSSDWSGVRAPVDCRCSAPVVRLCHLSGRPFLLTPYRVQSLFDWLDDGQGGSQRPGIAGRLDGVRFSLSDFIRPPPGGSRRCIWGANAGPPSYPASVSVGSFAAMPLAVTILLVRFGAKPARTTPSRSWPL